DRRHSAFVSLLPRPSSYTLFPYTTLFRSVSRGKEMDHEAFVVLLVLLEKVLVKPLDGEGFFNVFEFEVLAFFPQLGQTACGGLRSEEHTSELQSREKLVCRLLLEKKKWVQ